jgi:flagellar assembly factor FliW
MTVETTRFGEVEVKPEEIIYFPEPLPGLESARRFFIQQPRTASHFLWLQAVEEPGLALVVTDPRLYFPHYAVTLHEREMALIGAETPDDVAIWVILTVHAGGREVTANLAAPLLVCGVQNRGVQAILDGEQYSTRQPLTAAQPQPLRRAA